MKKIAALSILAVVFLIAWKENKYISPAFNKKEVINAESANFFRDTVSSEKAKRMFGKFKNDFRRGQTVISKFNRNELITLLNSMPADSVTFFVAMHEDNDPRVRNKGVVLMKVQVPDASGPSSSKSSLANARIYLNHFFYLAGSVCPPPSDCVIE